MFDLGILSGALDSEPPSLPGTEPLRCAAPVLSHERPAKAEAFAKCPGDTSAWPKACVAFGFSLVFRVCAVCRWGRWGFWRPLPWLSFRRLWCRVGYTVPCVISGAVRTQEHESDGGLMILVYSLCVSAQPWQQKVWPTSRENTKAPSALVAKLFGLQCFYVRGLLVKGLKKHFGVSESSMWVQVSCRWRLFFFCSHGSVESWGFPYLAAWSMILTLFCI